MDYPASPIFDSRLDGTVSQLSHHSSHCQSRSSTSSTSSSSSSSTKSSVEARHGSCHQGKVSTGSYLTSSGGCRHSSTSSTESYPIVVTSPSEYHHNHHQSYHQNQRCNCKDARPTSPQQQRSTTPSSSSHHKGVLRKEDAVDLVDVEARKKMERGISHATANESLVSAARTVVQHDFSEDATTSVVCSVETPQFTFTLPDLTRYTEDFRGFLEKDLIELSALISLEQSGRLNWWADTGTCQRLWPLATTGDGNCLLHAASLGMWGFHDRLLTLRKTLHNFLTHSSACEAIYRRWRWQCAQQNYQSGLSLTEPEWREEWSSVLRLASPDPRITTSTNNNSSGSSAPKRRSRLSTVSEDLDQDPLYESLEEIHVLVLAHVLRRPIIVVSDTDAYGEALAPILFGGIYLPLEVSPSDCDRSPLILTYDAGHFSALVAMQSVSSLPTVIPLSDNEHSILPVQFALDPGQTIDWARDENNPNVLNTLDLTEGEKLVLLKEYLDVVQVPLPACFLDPPTTSSGQNYLEAELELTSPDSMESTSLRDCEVASHCSQSSQGHEVMPHPSGKSKTAKQLQSVVKQFGSIGKSVSKKIKKNFGSITRLARTGSFRGSRSGVVSQTTRLETCRIVAGHQDYILAAMIHTQKCLPYLQEMINNYLHEARDRFDKDKEMKAMQNAERKRKEYDRMGGCVSPDYDINSRDLCHDSAALYGSGKSKFYVNSDDQAHETLTHVPVCKHLTLRNNDRTLYLANSTFYRDRDSSLVVPIPANNPDPMPIVPVDYPPPKPPVRNLRKKGVSNLISAEYKQNNSLTHVPNNNYSQDSVPDGGSYRKCIDELDSKHKMNNVDLQLRSEAKLCQTKGCSFFGSFENNSYCSKCFKESQQAPQTQRRVYRSNV